MPSRRVMRTWLPVAAVCAAIGVAPSPAVANGPSAGDNQYTDPLAGQNGHTTTSKHTTPPPTHTTTTTTTSTPPPSTTPSSSAPAPSTTSAAPEPTATTAAATASTKDPKTLPMTGFDATAGAGLGFLLLGAGLLVRRRVLA